MSTFTRWNGPYEGEFGTAAYQRLMEEVNILHRQLEEVKTAIGFPTTVNTSIDTKVEEHNVNTEAHPSILNGMDELQLSFNDLQYQFEMVAHYYEANKSDIDMSEDTITFLKNVITNLDVTIKGYLNVNKTITLVGGTDQDSEERRVGSGVFNTTPMRFLPVGPRLGTATIPNSEPPYTDTVLYLGALKDYHTPGTLIVVSRDDISWNARINFTSNFISVEYDTTMFIPEDPEDLPPMKFGIYQGTDYNGEVHRWVGYRTWPMASGGVRAVGLNVDFETLPNGLTTLVAAGYYSSIPDNISNDSQELILEVDIGYYSKGKSTKGTENAHVLQSDYVRDQARHKVLTTREQDQVLMVGDVDTPHHLTLASSDRPTVELSPQVAHYVAYLDDITESIHWQRSVNVIEDTLDALNALKVWVDVNGNVVSPDSPDRDQEVPGYYTSIPAVGPGGLIHPSGYVFGSDPLVVDHALLLKQNPNFKRLPDTYLPTELIPADGTDVTFLSSQLINLTEDKIIEGDRDPDAKNGTTVIDRLGQWGKVVGIDRSQSGSDPTITVRSAHETALFSYTAPQYAVWDHTEGEFVLEGTPILIPEHPNGYIWDITYQWAGRHKEERLYLGELYTYYAEAYLLWTPFYENNVTVSFSGQPWDFIDLDFNYYTTIVQREGGGNLPFTMDSTQSAVICIDFEYPIDYNGLGEPDQPTNPFVSGLFNLDYTDQNVGTPSPPRNTFLNITGRWTTTGQGIVESIYRNLNANLYVKMAYGTVKGSVADTKPSAYVLRVTWEVESSETYLNRPTGQGFFTPYTYNVQYKPITVKTYETEPTPALYTLTDLDLFVTPKPLRWMSRYERGVSTYLELSKFNALPVDTNFFVITGDYSLGDIAPGVYIHDTPTTWTRQSYLPDVGDGSGLVNISFWYPFDYVFSPENTPESRMVWGAMFLHRVYPPGIVFPYLRDITNLNTRILTWIVSDGSEEGDEAAGWKTGTVVPEPGETFYIKFELYGEEPHPMQGAVCLVQAQPASTGLTLRRYLTGLISQFNRPAIWEIEDWDIGLSFKTNKLLEPEDLPDNITELKSLAGSIDTSTQARRWLELIVPAQAEDESGEEVELPNIFANSIIKVTASPTNTYPGQGEVNFEVMLQSSLTAPATISGTYPFSTMPVYRAQDLNFFKLYVPIDLPGTYKGETANFVGYTVVKEPIGYDLNNFTLGVNVVLEADIPGDKVEVPQNFFPSNFGDMHYVKDYGGFATTPDDLPSPGIPGTTFLVSNSDSGYYYEWHWEPTTPGSETGEWVEDGQAPDLTKGATYNANRNYSQGTYDIKMGSLIIMSGGTPMSTFIYYLTSVDLAPYTKRYQYNFTTDGTTPNTAANGFGPNTSNWPSLGVPSAIELYDCTTPGQRVFSGIALVTIDFHGAWNQPVSGVSTQYSGEPFLFTIQDPGSQMTAVLTKTPLITRIPGFKVPTKYGAIDRVSDTVPTATTQLNLYRGNVGQVPDDLFILYIERLNTVVCYYWDPISLQWTVETSTLNPLFSIVYGDIFYIPRFWSSNTEVVSETQVLGFWSQSYRTVTSLGLFTTVEVSGSSFGGYRFATPYGGTGAGTSTYNSVILATGMGIGDRGLWYDQTNNVWKIIVYQGPPTGWADDPVSTANMKTGDIFYVQEFYGYDPSNTQARSNGLMFYSKEVSTDIQWTLLNSTESISTYITGITDV